MSYKKLTPLRGRMAIISTSRQTMFSFLQRHCELDAYIPNCRWENWDSGKPNYLLNIPMISNGRARNWTQAAYPLKKSTLLLAILIYPILSYPILSCPVLSCPILSYPSYLITLHSWRHSIHCWTVEVVRRGGSSGVPCEVTAFSQLGIIEFFFRPVLWSRHWHEDSCCWWCLIVVGVLTKWSFTGSSHSTCEDSRLNSDMLKTILGSPIICTLTPYVF